MKTILIGSLLVAGLFSLAPLPAAAQTIELGPRGPSVDLRSRGERERDEIRREERREEYRDERRRERRRDLDDDMPRRRY